jgi:hypothetical protein
MELVLFILFLVISFVLITLGLIFSNHTELSLIGFTFLFLLSFPIITENITYTTGSNTYSQFNYSSLDGNYTLLTSSYESQTDIKTSIFEESDLSHYFGYYMAVISVVGFIATLIGIKRSKDYT